MPEEKVKEETKVNRSNVVQKLVKIFSVIIFLIIIVILIIIANASETFTIGPAIVIGIVSFIFFGIIAFSFEIKGIILRIWKPQEKEGLPNPVTEQQAFELIGKKFKSKYLADYIDEIISGGAEIRGKAPLTQWIYFLHFKTLYSRQKYFCGLNMHYPDKVQIIKNPKPNAILTAKKRLATEPEEAPDIEEISTFNPSLGLSTIKKKLTHRKKVKQKEEQIGDLR